MITPAGIPAAGVAYLHCPHCEQTAWFDTSIEPPHHCRRCGTELAVMPERHANSLTTALLRRFERDMQLDTGRLRFVRG